MKAKIDRVKNEILYLDENDGKIKKAEIVSALCEKSVKIEKDIVAEKNAEITILQSKVSFLEKNIKTFSIKEWEEYREL